MLYDKVEKRLCSPLTKVLDQRASRWNFHPDSRLRKTPREPYAKQTYGESIPIYRKRSCTISFHKVATLTRPGWDGDPIWSERTCSIPWHMKLGTLMVEWPINLLDGPRCKGIHTLYDIHYPLTLRRNGKNYTYGTSHSYSLVVSNWLLTVQIEVNNNVNETYIQTCILLYRAGESSRRSWSSGLMAWWDRKIQAYLGTMSLKSSNLILPAGVSPICMSMKTVGLCILVDPRVNESENSETASNGICRN